jgi:hypothetical protein
MDSNYQRRTFLRKAATVATALVVTPYLVNSIGQTEPSKEKLSDGKLSDNKQSGGQPSINRAFQVYCYKDGRVELRTPRKSEVKISHSYDAGFEVDVLLLMACNKSIDNNLNEIAMRHSLSETTSKNRAEKLMNELNSKGLICYGDSAITKNTAELYA